MMLTMLTMFIACGVSNSTFSSPRICTRRGCCYWKPTQCLVGISVGICLNSTGKRVSFFSWVPHVLMLMPTRTLEPRHQNPHLNHRSTANDPACLEHPPFVASCHGKLGDFPPFSMEAEDMNHSKILKI